jgi:hypothetical protein
MQFERVESMQKFMLHSRHDLMLYMSQEGNQGTELLPLLKVTTGNKIRGEVLSVRYQSPFLIALVECLVEPADLLEFGDQGISPLEVRQLHVDAVLAKATRPADDLRAWVDACLQPDIAIEMGLMWPADLEVSLSQKHIESLEIELESAHEIIKLLINVAKDLAQGSGEQLQEQVVERVAANMLANSAASELAASTEDDLRDMLSSALGGMLQSDIRDEISQQIATLNKLDQLALSLCEPDEVLENWVENQFCSFPTPEYSTDIELSCELLIDDMAREVENIIHQESDS